MTYKRKRACSMPGWALLFWKFGPASKSSSSSFSCPEISPRIHSMWRFLPVSFPLWHLRSRQRDLFPHFVDSSSFTKKPGRIIRDAAHSSGHMPIYNSILSFCSTWISLPALSLFLPLLHLNLFFFFKANFLSFVHFCKMSHGFVTGRQAPKTTHFVVRVWIESYMSGNSHGQTERRCDWWLITGHICYLGNCL